MRKLMVLLAVVIAFMVVAVALAGDPTPQPNVTLDVAGQSAKLTGVALEVGYTVMIDGKIKAWVVEAEDDTATLDGDFGGVTSGTYAVVKDYDSVLWIEFDDPPEAPEPPILRCPPVC